MSEGDFGTLFCKLLGRGDSSQDLRKFLASTEGLDESTSVEAFSARPSVHCTHRSRMTRHYKIGVFVTFKLRTSDPQVSQVLGDLFVSLEDLDDS